VRDLPLRLLLQRQGKKMVFGLFKKKNKEQKKDERFQMLKIREVVPVAKEAVNVVFEKPEGNFNYKPGQFITIIKEVEGKKIRRAYSLCTTPFEDEYPAVTVKRVPGGLMSNHINDTFKAGDEVEIMNPMGMFTTEYSAQNKRKAVFFGGGSGITPLYSVMRSILIKEPTSEVVLVYGNRSEEYIVFKEELSQLEADCGGRFKLVHILEEDSKGFAQHVGRPTAEMISDLTKNLGVDRDTEFYICGPAPMMNITKEGLELAGITDQKIRMESFEAGKTSPADINDTGDNTFEGESEVTILMYGEEHVIKVDAKDHILDAGLDANIDMPYSCQSGLCTACRAKCLEGQVDQQDAEGLTKSEEEEGYVLLCVGKPKSPKIKLEVG